MNLEEQHSKDLIQTEESKLTNTEICDDCHGSGMTGEVHCSSCNGRGLI
jgi:DnaJ-class molecular chaperone